MTTVVIPSKKLGFSLSLFLFLYSRRKSTRVRDANGSSLYARCESRVRGWGTGVRRRRRREGLARKKGPRARALGFLWWATQGENSAAAVVDPHHSSSRHLKIPPPLKSEKEERERKIRVGSSSFSLSLLLLVMLSCIHDRGPHLCPIGTVCTEYMYMKRKGDYND